MDQKKLAEQIKSLFKIGPVVLILGSRYKEELSDDFLKLEWNCIITSSQDSELATQFAFDNRRIPNNILDPDILERLGKKALDRKNLSIVRLYGISGIENQDSNLSERALRNQKQSVARKMLNCLPGIIGQQFGWVIVAGYDPYCDEDIDQNDLYNALHDLGQPIVRFFGIIGQAGNGAISDLVNEKIAKVYDTPISQLLLLSNDEEEEEIVYNQQNNGRTIFIEKRAISVDDEITFETEGFAQLLTVEEVKRFVLRKKGEQRDWFYKFLKFSSDGPQWYGYNELSDFHLHRDFEHTLLRLVEARLANKHLPDFSEGLDKEDTLSDKNERDLYKKAILLCGHPCSSKSITLGALAYRVFDEKKYPVVYISNPDVNLSQNSPSFAALDKLLEKLENLGALNILLIWDSSSYNDINRTCKSLNDVMNNRGRKVVLVCSSYEQPQDFYKHQKFYTKEKNIVEARNFYVIKTSQELTEREAKDLKNLIAERSGIHRGSFEDFWNNKENIYTNLLTRLYTMLYELHPQLEYGLNREYNTSIQNIKEVMANMPKIEQEKTTFEKAFENAGIKTVNSYEESNLDWEFFTAIIAIFSRFKLDTPVSIAMQALNLPFNSNYSMVYRKIMDMPWVSYHTNDLIESSGDYMFSFRSSLEAEIYLNKSGIDPQKQIEYIAKLIDFIGTDNREQRANFSTAIQRVEKLIRIIGPNTNNIQLTSGILRNDYKAFKASYPILISALEKLHDEYKYEDPKLINQEVTFIREYYYNIYNDLHEDSDYLIRINKINSAIITANKAINLLNNEISGRNIDKSYYFSEIGMRNSLVVETVFCDLRVRDLISRYRAQMSNSGKIKEEIDKVIDSIPVRSEPFSLVMDKLLGVIYDNPSNSYAYSALFNKFLSEYENDDLPSIERLRYLSAIQTLIAEVDNSNNEVIYDEVYNKLVLRIEDIAQSSIGGISIENIDIPNLQHNNKNNQFRTFYKKMISEKNASAIYLLADNIRRKANINYNSSLNEKQKVSCKDIIEFLSREDYAEAVDQHPGCQYMLLRLKWLIYNDSPIFSGYECQLTKMSAEKWREIASISKHYAASFLSSGERNYLASTIYYLIALASAQLGDFEESDQAFHKINEENFYSQVRNKTWHILCNENGEPINFVGEFDKERYDENKRTGRAYVSNVSRSRADLIYYHLLNLGWSSIRPGIHKDLEIGISYIGFSIYRAAGRKKRQ